MKHNGHPAITTVGGLRRAGWKVLPVKEELRRNLITKITARERLFEGVVGYDDTVIPALINAILSRHDIILLGLRGQAKTRLVRLLPTLLDEWTPIVAGSELNDNPFQPISKRAADLVAEYGDDTEIEWIPREQRYGEKLATPDVTIADLIGDIDPIKAAAQRLHYSHEGAIHFGLIPRANRGIFAINELPDLQPRIQVGLFNIMQEKDIQIRGFNVRIPLDVLMVFTANPEDYTNRGNIITPLKDRIDSQILTHYPVDLAHAVDITRQEAWTERGSGVTIHIPDWFRELIEQIAFEARGSEFVDQRSGVSARLTISAMENLVSNAERRAIVNGESVAAPRISDLGRILPSMTGKLELVYEGEQEGLVTVSKALIGKAARTVFARYFPDPLPKSRQSRRAQQGEKRENAGSPESVYRPIIAWFEGGRDLLLTDDMPQNEYVALLSSVPGLRALAQGQFGGDETSLAPAMELILEGLHQHSKLAKSEDDGIVGYRDMLGTLLSTMDQGEETF
ncbi:MAG: sigma 54-interacting transcriptional regulator [Ignavibacteriae bacterium]|nr:sigma 54-interacting transcriptional regulator [Ignavibacteriota bacterium]